MRHREPGEGARVDGCVRRGVQAGEVDVERGLAVQRIHAVVGALRYHHRLADATPAVADADPERAVRGNGRSHDAVRQHLRAVQLGGRRHLEVVAGAAADERDPGSGDGICATDDLLLVARQSIGEEEQHPVFALLDPREARRNVRATFAQPISVERSCRRGDGEAFTAERGDHDAEVGRAGGRDLSCSRAADQRRAVGNVIDPGEQLLQVVGVGAEDDQQRGRSPSDGKRRRLGPGCI